MADEKVRCNVGNGWQERKAVLLVFFVFPCFVSVGKENQLRFYPCSAKGVFPLLSVRSEVFILNRKRIVCGCGYWFPNPFVSASLCDMYRRCLSLFRMVVCHARRPVYHVRLKNPLLNYRMRISCKSYGGVRATSYGVVAVGSWLAGSILPSVVGALRRLLCIGVVPCFVQNLALIFNRWARRGCDALYTPNRGSF